MTTMQPSTDIPQDDTPPSAAAPDSVRADIEAALAAASQESPGDAVATETEDSASAPETASADAEVEGTAAPASWTKDAKNDWTMIPERAQAEIRRREREIQSKLAETSEARKTFEGIAPYVAEMKAAGLEPGEYVSNLLSWNAALRTQPAQALAALSQQFIQDAQSARAVVQALSQRFGLADIDGYDEPQQPAVNPQVANLEQRLQAQELAAARREWADFTSAKGADGQPLYPYVEELKQEIAEAIRANPRLSYAEAYGKAQWLNSEIRGKVQAAEAKAKATAAADKARKASGMTLPRGASDNAGESGSRRTLREDLLTNARQMGFRV